MKARRAARRLALDVLYEAEIRDLLPSDVFASHDSSEWVVPAPEDEEPQVDSGEPPVRGAVDYARVLVDGVQAHQAEIDALIVSYADRWAIQRMPVVDRTLVRIALFELLWREDIPVAVAINEAVELAKSLSTDDSGRFINGLLGRIADIEAAR